MLILVVLLRRDPLIDRFGDAPAPAFTASRNLNQRSDPLSLFSITVWEKMGMYSHIESGARPIVGHAIMNLIAVALNHKEVTQR